MKQARLQGADIIVNVWSYAPQKGDVLLCADKCCQAELYYTPQTIDQNGHVLPANFSSIRRTDHRAHCTQLSAENNMFEPSLSLKQGVLAGHVIILSLNNLFGIPPQLWRDFGNATHSRQLDTPLNQLKNDAQYPDGRKGHVSHSVKSVGDLIHTIRLIHKHGGDAAVQRTYLTWQHGIQSFSDFYIYKQKQQVELFRSLYKKAKAQQDFYAVTNGVEKLAYDMPYLLPFYPSQNLRESSTARLQSKSITLVESTSTGAKLFLQHQIELASNNQEAKAKEIFMAGVFVLATPHVVASRAMPVMQDYSKDKTGFVCIHWNAKDASQYTASCGIQLPKQRATPPERLLI